MKKSFSIDGQLSLWDVDIVKMPEKVTKTPENVIKSIVLDTRAVNLVTEKQRMVIEKYKSVNKDVLRIIHYSGGGLGIELREDSKLITKYFNRNGECEFIKDKQLSVLPMDEILLNNLGDIQMNRVQTDIINSLLFQSQANIKKVIKRKGDYNVIVEYDSKIQFITPEGRQLELKNIQAIYEKNEIFIEPQGIQNKETEDIQEDAKIGDYVQAIFQERLIEGNIVNVYGLNDAILNIVFDNGTKHTAIGRMAIKKILKSA